MNHKRSSWLFRGALTIAIIIFPYFTMAQTDPGPCPDCPIDNGLVLLIAVGLLYGMKKYWAFTKKVNPELG